MMKLPNWVEEIFNQSVCPFKECQKKLVEDGVIAVGIREEKSPSGEPIISFFYEYKCEHCTKRSVFTGFPTTLDDFISDMIEISSIESGEGDMEPRKTKISSSEFESAKKMIRKSKNFKEFMGYFGINDVGPDENDEQQNK